MDNTLLGDVVSRLGKYAFESFVFELLSTEYGEDFEPAPGLGESVYLRDWRRGHYYGVYLIHFLPLFELLKTPTNIDLKDKEVIQRLENIREHNEREFHERYNSRLVDWHHRNDDEFQKSHFRYNLTQEYSPLQTIFFLNNLVRLTDQENNTLGLQYQAILDSLGFPSVQAQTGNIKTFIDHSPIKVEGSLKAVLQSYREGVCVTLSRDGISVNKISSEKPLFCGVANQSLNPYETIYTYPSPREGYLLKEFAALINRNAKEADLEEFLRTHYKDIFGGIYDQVETQLWLRFPELDIAGKDRRLDIFLRNSVSNDWELFEVKRAVQLTRTYRDSPVIASEVLYAVQQVQNYAGILAQDEVKRKFAADGIEYFEPVLKLVIGRKPQIPHQQWRSLVVRNKKDVKLITFDDLIKEMAIRFKDRHWIA